MVGLLLVDGSRLDRLAQELVDSIRRLLGRALLPLTTELEPLRGLHLNN